MALNELLRMVSDSETPETNLTATTEVGALTGAEAQVNLNVDAADKTNPDLHIDCVVEASDDGETWNPISAFNWDGNTTDKQGNISNGPAIRFDSALIAGKTVRISATANLPMRYVMLLQEVV